MVISSRARVAAGERPQLALERCELAVEVVDHAEQDRE
jgi:hypothetical protein